LLVAGGIVSSFWLTTGPINLVALSPVRAAEPQSNKVLTNSQTILLMSVARTIAPHDGLPDAAYELVVQAIDKGAATDASTRAIVTSGLEHLGQNFVSHSEEQRVQSLKAMEHSEFFRLVRARTLGVLYSSPLAYAHFGYEGEAFSKGGYLLRGFNDLTWLPDVPLKDSGPVITE
jgi:hypothetical protein